MMRAWVAAICVVGANGCTSSTATVADAGPTGQPTIAFEGLDGDAPCLSLGEDLTLPTSIALAVDEALLRPPGGCGTLLQCGSVRLLVDGEENAESSVLSVGLRPDLLDEPYRDGTPDPVTGEPTLMHLRVELVAESGDVLLDPFTFDEVFDEVEVRTAIDCAATP